MAKRNNESERRLAYYWNPPSSLPHDEAPIGVGKPIACVATTYTFHAPLIETDLLPRFLGLRFDSNERERAFVVERERSLGTTQVSVLVDQDHVDGSQTTLRWDQLPVDVPGGCQHAKIVLLLWERCLRLIVSSANITRTGYRWNREIGASLDFFDDATSTPGSLATDTLDFLDKIINSGWIRAAKQPVDRLSGSLSDIRSRLRGWQRMPRDFTPRETPRVAFVAGMPAGRGRRMSSPLSQLLEVWGKRRATEVTVMTPFVGESRESHVKVIDKLLEVPRQSDSVSELIVPGVPSEADPNQMVVLLPRWFRDSWGAAWKTPVKELATWVVPRCRSSAGEKVGRDLHAKAIVLADDERVAVFCGSSNFSPHGMGVSVANVEANLCYLDRADSRALRALPVDWDRDRPSTPPKWLEDPEPLEDDAEPTAPRLPCVFSWATFDQRAGTVTVGFDDRCALPAEWSIALASGDGADMVLLDGEILAGIPEERVWSKTLEGLKRGAALTVLKVRWRENPSDAPANALLPVHTTSGDALLPPEEFRTLTADAIIACLVSGRDPAELADLSGSSVMTNTDQAARGSSNPLRFVDTTTYPMYKSRRLGRALATLGERIVRTVHTSVAMAHRLQQDPLGPVNLARAVASDRTAKGDDPASFDRAYVLFALAEIQLTLAYAGKRVHADRNAHEPDLRDVFIAAIRDIERERHRILAPEPSSLQPSSAYIDRVHVQCSQLLDRQVDGGPHAS
jgi:hypothetical protein